MARLSLEERLNRIESKISEKSFRENKGLEMKSDIMYLIMIQEQNWKCVIISHT